MSYLGKLVVTHSHRTVRIKTEMKISPEQETEKMTQNILQEPLTVEVICIEEDSNPDSDGSFNRNHEETETDLHLKSNNSTKQIIC